MHFVSSLVVKVKVVFRQGRPCLADSVALEATGHVHTISASCAHGKSGFHNASCPHRCFSVAMLAAYIPIRFMPMSVPMQSGVSSF